MTNATDTATEAAAIAQRASDKIAEYYGEEENPTITDIIAAELAPLIARAEAGDRLAEAMNEFRNSPNERGHTVADFWRLADAVTDALAAYRALAEQEAG